MLRSQLKFDDTAIERIKLQSAEIFVERHAERFIIYETWTKRMKDLTISRTSEIIFDCIQSTDSLQHP